MQYRNMGRTGLKVSEVCLGTMKFGHGTDERASGRIAQQLSVRSLLRSMRMPVL